MLQRVGIAQALINDPDVVFLDEPMSGLDPIGRRDVRSLILRLRDEGRTVFFSSHILSDAETLCSRVAVLATWAARRHGRPLGDARVPGAGVGSGRRRAGGRERVRRRHDADAAAHPADSEQGGPALEFEPERDAARIAQAVAAAGGDPRLDRPGRASLEDFFVQQVAGADWERMG